MKWISTLMSRIMSDMTIVLGLHEGRKSSRKWPVSPGVDPSEVSFPVGVVIFTPTDCGSCGGEIGGAGGC